MQPWQVFAYLEQMTNYKAIDALRRSAAKKRSRGATARPVDLSEVPSRDISVSDDFSLQEEIRLTSAKLSGSERTICMCRVDKVSWEEIGELMELPASAAQKRHERALKRVARERQISNSRSRADGGWASRSRKLNAIACC